MSDFKLNGSISVIDTFTGEVIDLTYNSANELKHKYLRANALLKALSDAINGMKADFKIVVDNLGDGQTYEFNDGYRFKVFQPERLEYRKQDVAKYLDQDQLDVVLKVDKTAVKQLFKDMVEEGSLPKGAFKEVEGNAYRKPSTPFVRLVK